MRTSTKLFINSVSSMGRIGNDIEVVLTFCIELTRDQTKLELKFSQLYPRHKQIRLTFTKI